MMFQLLVIIEMFTELKVFERKIKSVQLCFETSEYLIDLL
jgi:hypothetical protein